MKSKEEKREQSEIDTIDVAKDFFLGDFVFGELKYTPIESDIKSNLELADCIINYGNNIIAFQVKGRNGAPKPDGDRNWIADHINKAKSQLVSTFNQLVDNTIPAFQNEKGDCFKISQEGVLFTGIIILQNNAMVSYKKVLSCNRLNGILHCFSYADFKLCCKKLVLPHDIMGYLFYRERKYQMDRDISVPEEDTVNAFLMEKYKTTIFDEENVDRFRWVLDKYRERLIEKNDKSNYREIIEVLLQFDRIGVEVFTSCLDKVIKYAKEKTNTEDICIKSLEPGGCSILFMSDTELRKEHMLFVSDLFMYKTKSEKCLTVFIYFEDDENFDIYWCYEEAEWVYDKEMEELCSVPGIREKWIFKNKAIDLVPIEE